MLETLEHALSLLNQMSAAAQEEDWEAVTELQSQYSQQLANAGSTPALPADAEKAASMIREMKVLEQQLMAMTAQRRNEAASQIRQQSHARRATNAYAAMGRKRF